MISHEKCPACGGTTVAKIGEETVQIVGPPDSILQAGTNAMLTYVLACDSLTTETMLCTACRHVYLSPTFDEDALDRYYSAECLALGKIQFRASERMSGKSWAEQHNICPDDQATLLAAAHRYRPRRLHELVTRATHRDGFGAILDFGGQTGEMTARFAASRRYVFDKEISQVTDSQVIPLASHDEMIARGPYDLIVLSHVLEHVPFPIDLMASLREALSADGFLYVEVPIEYCGTIVKRKGIPLGGHVNYFCRSSLLCCLRATGFGSIPMIRREVSLVGEVHTPVLKAVAAPSSSRCSGPRLWPWVVDLAIDMYLTFRARKWRPQLG